MLTARRSGGATSSHAAVREQSHRLQMSGVVQMESVMRSLRRDQPTQFPGDDGVTGPAGDLLLHQVEAGGDEGHAHQQVEGHANELQLRVRRVLRFCGGC